jgi:hypothetical protein
MTDSEIVASPALSPLVALVLYASPGDGGFARVGDCAVFVPAASDSGRALAWCRALNREFLGEARTLGDAWREVGATPAAAAVIWSGPDGIELLMVGPMVAVVQCEDDRAEYTASAPGSTELWIDSRFEQISVGLAGAPPVATYSLLANDDEAFVAAGAVAVLGVANFPATAVPPPTIIDRSVSLASQQPHGRLTGASVSVDQRVVLVLPDGAVIALDAPCLLVWGDDVVNSPHRSVRVTSHGGGPSASVLASVHASTISLTNDSLTNDMQIVRADGAVTDTVVPGASAVATVGDRVEVASIGVRLASLRR